MVGAAGAAQVRSGNSNATDRGRGASPGTLGLDVIEDPVVTEASLIHRPRGKGVSLANRDLAPVVDDVLIAAKRARLREKSGACAAGNIGIRLIVTEPAKQAIGARDIVVQTNVKLGFVEAAHRLVQKVEGTVGSATVATGVRIRSRVEVDQGLSYGVSEAIRASRDFVTGSSRGLASVRVSRQRIPCPIALEEGIGGAKHIRIGDHASMIRSVGRTNTTIGSGEIGNAKVVCAEVAITHGERRDQSLKGNAVALVLLLAIEKKEGLILLDGPANRATKLIQIELFRLARKETLGIQ